MFREALLESSPVFRKYRRWPMATAFTAELIVAAALVLLPLISTGVIPLSATRLILPTPPQFTPVARRPATPPSGSQTGVTLPHVPQVISVANHNPVLPNPFARVPANDSDGPPNFQPYAGSGNGLPDLGIRGTPIPPPPVRRIVISHPSEAMLLYKVVPEYPRLAQISGVQGDVKLHAIIAKDGTIQSLTVTSGHSLLTRAAVDAVQQWRYRPYMLNGDPVEVETVITVSFKKVGS